MFRGDPPTENEHVPAERPGLVVHVGGMVDREYVVVPNGEDAVYALAFEEGRRAIDQQAATLTDTRDRVGTVLSAAAVTIGLATGLAAGNGRHLRAFGVAGALIAGTGFVVLTVQAIRIWWPFPVTLTLDAGVLVGSYAEGDPPASISETRRELALHLGRHTQANRERIDKRLTWFTGALVGFLTEVVGLVMLLLDLGRK